MSDRSTDRRKPYQLFDSAYALDDSFCPRGALNRTMVIQSPEMGGSVISNDSKVYSAPRRKSDRPTTAAAVAGPIKNNNSIGNNSNSDGSPRHADNRSTPTSTSPQQNTGQGGYERTDNSTASPRKPVQRGATRTDHTSDVTDVPPPKRFTSPPKVPAAPPQQQIRQTNTAILEKGTPLISKPIKPFDPLKTRLRKPPGKELFHVRVSLGYLIGLRMEQIIKKKKREMSNSLVVGYAALPKSNKQISFSQPLVPNIGNSSKNKPQRLYWANPKRRMAQSAATKSKRVLHFAVELDRYDRSTAGDDDILSTDSISSYFPEVVKMVIGLRCGNERFPLGIANLVIDGRNISNHRVDLSVRPISDISEVIPTRAKPYRRGIFGNGKKQLKNSFSSDDFSYRLASNSTLRIKIDVVANFDVPDPNDVWGHLEFDDESSCLTNWSMSASTSNKMYERRIAPLKSNIVFTDPIPMEEPLPEPRKEESPEQTKLALQTSSQLTAIRLVPEIVIKPKLASQREARSVDATLSSEWIEVMPHFNGAAIVTSQKGMNDFNRSRASASGDRLGVPREIDSFASSKSSKTKKDLTSLVEGLPLNYVSFQIPKDEHSLTSRLTQPFFPEKTSFFIKSCIQIATCGEDDGSYGDEQMFDSFSFDSVVDRGYSSSFNHSSKHSSNGTTDSAAAESETVYSRSMGSSLSRERILVTKNRNRPLEAANDRQQDTRDDESSQMTRGIDRLADDISLDTYTDLKDAQATLVRYARKVGVDMEDLLDSANREKLLRAAARKKKTRDLTSDPSLLDESDNRERE